MSHYSQTNYRELPERGKLLPAMTKGLSIEDEMAGKLILPTEVKICATCSYWDGERRVDADMNVVVVDDECLGECLAQGQTKSGLHDVRQEYECIWEDLGPDDSVSGKTA